MRAPLLRRDHRGVALRIKRAALSGIAEKFPQPRQKFPQAAAKIPAPARTGIPL
jgi:hypothetical protein